MKKMPLNRGLNVDIVKLFPTQNYNVFVVSGMVYGAKIDKILHPFFMGHSPTHLGFNVFNFLRSVEL